MEVIRNEGGHDEVPEDEFRAAMQAALKAGMVKLASYAEDPRVAAVVVMIAHEGENPNAPGEPGYFVDAEHEGEGAALEACLRSAYYMLRLPS